MGLKTAIAVRLKPGPRWNPAKSVREQELWDEHACFVDDLHERGVIRIAGPFPDGSGALVIMDVQSVDEARAIYANDPWAIQNILLADEVKEWTIFLDNWSQDETS